MLLSKPIRRVVLTEDELSRLNHLRFRAGVGDLSMEEAVDLLNRMTNEAFTETLARIRG